jgi:hypothetical protein
MKCTENHQSTNCWVEGSEKVYFLFLFRRVVMVGGMGGKKMGGVFIMHQTHLDVTHGRLKEKEGGPMAPRIWGESGSGTLHPPPHHRQQWRTFIFMMREKKTSFFISLFHSPLSLGPTFFSYSTPTSSALPAVIVPSHFFSSLPPHFFFHSLPGLLLAPASGRGHKEGGGECNKSIFLYF